MHIHIVIIQITYKYATLFFYNIIERNNIINLTSDVIYLQ